MNKRRKVLFIVTVFTFPLIFFNLAAVLFLPVLQFMNPAFVKGFLIVEFCIWGAIAFSAVFVQRYHCSHTCAMTGLFELIGILTKSKDVMKMKYPRPLKYIILAMWDIGFAFILLSNLGKCFHWFAVAPIYTTPIVVCYYTLFFISGILSLTTGKSKTEHYICPIAPWTLSMIKLGKKLHIPSYTVITNVDKCVKCGLCSKNCMIGDSVCDKVQTGRFNQIECMNCLDCVKACKTGALSCKFTAENK